jgi:hypothetical protein
VRGLLFVALILRATVVAPIFVGARRGLAQVRKLFDPSKSAWTKASGLPHRVARISDRKFVVN